MRGALAGLLFLGCSQKLDPVTPIDPPSDADADADADADSDTDTDVDTDVPSNVDCDEPYDTPPPGQTGFFPECVTEQVFCGTTIYATTEGGTEEYDYDYWLANQTLGGLVQSANRPLVAGTERVYVMEGVPPGTGVNVTVESCTPLWASYMTMGDITPFCPENAPSNTQHFTAVSGRYVQEANILNATAFGTYRVQLIIDSPVTPQGSTNFVMTIECE